MVKCQQTQARPLLTLSPSLFAIHCLLVACYPSLWLLSALHHTLVLLFGINAARPGRRNSHNLSSGVVLSLCRDKAATMHAIANTGATLMLGQERSREETALAVDPCCRSNGIASA